MHADADGLSRVFAMAGGSEVRVEECGGVPL